MKDQQVIYRKMYEFWGPSFQVQKSLARSNETATVEAVVQIDVHAIPSQKESF